MAKKLFGEIVIIMLTLSLIVSGCGITKGNTLASSPAISKLTITSLPLPKSSSLSTPTSLPPTVAKSTSPKIPPFTANLITVHNYRGSDRNAVLFTNNMDNFSRFTCTITQHDASGSYLSDYNVTSDFVPPMSHLVTVLPEEIANGLTISNPQVFFVPFSSQPHFAIMSLSNLHTVPEDINDNRGDKSYTFLAGTLVNTGTERLGKGIGGNAVKPALITIQILKRTTDGSLTLVGDGFATSARGGNLGLSPSFFPQIIPIPPPGESVIFYLPLWQSITIKDGQKGTVDGEIIIVAPDR